MLPSEELELKIFRFAESAGRARWRPSDFGTLSRATQFHEDEVMVDALFDLHARGLMQFRQWSNERKDWMLYDGGSREYFYRPFDIRVTFPGRKYFERLEVGPTEPQRTEPIQSAPTPETRLRGAAERKPTVQAKLDSSPQVIGPSAPMPPRAFISHSGQDRQFVDKFAADLWAFGVMAWNFPWEIKPGDPIRQKIEEGLEGCEFFIIAISTASLSRPWVQTELDIAVDRKMNGKIRKIIPIKIERCDQLPPILHTLCWEDFTDQPYESALKRVLDSIFEVDRRPELGKRLNEHKDDQEL
jgi:hypothetical protein